MRALLDESHGSFPGAECCGRWVKRLAPAHVSWDHAFMASSDKRHWDSVYSAKAPDQVSWYRPHLDRSLQFVESARLPLDAAIIDVGGGASTFVDDLLDRGFCNLTVLDLSAAALETARERLGERGSRVQWMCADVIEAQLPERTYAFWHDRAVFHFLTDPAARARYVDAVRRALVPGGHIVVATFGPHGPEKCSGLDVVRFTPEGIHEEFGDSFAKIAESTETHNTPWGSEQEFVYCYCRLPE
jgi:SAM-dependent methyltransferase